MGRPRRRHRRDAGVRPADLCTRAHAERAREHALVDRLDRRRAAFGAFFWAWQGSEAGSQYLAGYLLERSLSLDNIFVFAVILTYFAVPGLQVQAKVLAWGIALALLSAARVHHPRRRAARRLPRDVLPVRRAAALHGIQARPPRRHGDRARAQPAAEAVAQAGDDHRRLRRRQAVHEGQRQARRDAAAGGLRGVASTESSSRSTRSRPSSPSPRSRSSSSPPTRSRSSACARCTSCSSA